MRMNDSTILKAAVRVASVLLAGAVVALGQQQVNLTAGPSTVTLPNGSTVPMWGYSCGAAVTGSTATCAALSKAGAGWSPVVITVPTGEDLQINLTNNLTFGTTSVPTSLTIVGQVGGGLGDLGQRTTAPSPDHSNAQTVTWPIVDPTTKGTPPVQGRRVQSFSTEVAAGATVPLTWKAPRPGTYLLESGTHPSIQGPMGLYGMVVVTTAPVGATAGTAYPAAGSTPAVTYNAEVPLLFSEIDPVQNNAVATAVNTAGFSETMVWSGQPGGCADPTSAYYHQCYPPAVNYTPLYYLINGTAFNRTSASASLFPTAPATGVSPTGKVLVRLVNAGLRMHVPSIVGSQTAGESGSGAAITAAGFSRIAEDGNPLPGVPRVQSEILMTAGKTDDVMINVPAAGSALPVFDRELSLSGNATARDAGMLAYVSINGAALPSSPALGGALANADTYNSLVAGQTFTVSNLAKGVVANDVNVYGVTLLTPPANGTVVLAANGTFTYTPTGTATSDSFTYCANGSVTAAVCSSGITATVTLGAAGVESGSGILVNNITYTSNVATALSIKSPGVLSVDKDNAGYPITVATSTVVPSSGLTVTVDAAGGFNASVATAGTYSFTYKAQNSQGTQSALTATVTLIFPTPSGLAVSVVDPTTKAGIGDYRWIIEEDRTFYIDPATRTNTGSAIVPTFGTNFHTSYMPVVATGCVGPTSCESGQTLLGQGAVCDMGNGICRTDASQQTAVDPSQVHLDPTKRYYISVLPGDGADALSPTSVGIGHGMGGAPIAAGQTAVTVLVEPTPFQTAKLSVFVFEDDFPLNGEQDGGGGIDVLSPNEPGLGGFNITLFDDAGGPGDATGQMTYDMFNMPLSNALAGTIDPSTGKDACPISSQATQDAAQRGITGTIVTCPKYESDNATLSPLAGQVVVANMMPGRYGVVATPAADRIARGEEWLQTNTLDGQKAHDSFLRVGEPSYFQEYGPAGYHVSIGFANPKIINGRREAVCNGTDPNISGTNCSNTVTGLITTERMSRTPDERLYSSGSNDSFAFTQCYVSFGDPDGEDFAFTKCNADGTFSLSGLPDGDWRITVFDQWNDMLVDGLSTPVRLAGGTTNLGDIAMNQWQANIYTTTFFDTNGNGVRDPGEGGLTFVSINNRFRDGSFSNFNSTDLDGNAGFNEVFPLFSWYVVEADTTRYKNTGTHVVYDAGGPADGTCTSTTAPCGNSNIAANMANTHELVALPTALRVPGARYCASADCPTGDTAGGSTGRVDPPWVLTEAWQGFSGQNSFLEFGKKPFAPTENGGIHGHVVYASTRPFDDPALLLQLSWEPQVPNVTMNLYQEGTAADGVTPTLKLVDTTKTSSWDDWAQGFRSDGVPNMNCPGQDTSDLFFFTLYNQPMWLDAYNNGGTPVHTIPNNSQFKCFDGMHNWNQLQPAPYDGYYLFPSVTARSTTTGLPTGTNCTICSANPTGDGTQMLPKGKYVVEVVVPPGYELVKEEDKNILIGDTYIAPVTQEFGGLGNVYILPDQAAVGALYNPNNAQNPTQNLGRIAGLPSHEGDTGSVETFWPCVGESRVVPDYISLFPQSAEVSPFAGATRNLCDRKEVTLDDQMSVLAKFYVFTSTHAAAHFTGVITDDFTSEFDPFSPQFGEKFSPPDLPVSLKDFAGNEISRVYADQWGSYNGLTYSTWEVNPPNPTGYAPQMMVTCMNDPGPIPGPGGTMITDPLFNPQYSQFCYEIPFMPGQTQYMDTPVVPTSAFAGAGYNNPDCAYPDATPAVSEVDGDGVGPWVSAAGHTLTITALGDQLVPNNAYSGPSATAAPYSAKKVTRHYGFGTTTGTVALVGSDGVARPLTGVSWSDTTITGTVPSGVPNCLMQQQLQYGGSTAQCGELAITAANGKQSIDTVTVTIGGKAPTHVTAGNPIQAAIDAAKPGDLLIVDPTCNVTTQTTPVACTTAGATKSQSVHEELLLMWKPIRLQGVGAASSIVNANTQPAGKLNDWRTRVDCLFGLAPNGTPGGYNSSCGAGWFAFAPTSNNPQVDRLPLEATVGWDATLNGNLAELLQEPTLMGALEGAAITVLSKGVNFPSNPFAADTFPTGTVLLDSTTNASHGCGANTANAHNPFPSSFWCNPSSVDGLGITDSSQGGGGIFVHGWGHNIQIANNRIYNNAGTLSGGINIGQGEHPGSYLQGAANADPGSCQATAYTNAANAQLPYCFYMNVNVHHNAITSNSSTGDELFSATPAGAGGVSFCTGADYYKFNFNWLCGNLSSGDGGGIAHIGFSYNGDIEHNSILFNQSTNPTISTNGGGLLIMGAPDVDPTCGATTDQDCVSAPSAITPSDGTGPNLFINANLIQGNAAESGSGGGLRLQAVNGSDVLAFPTTPARWYSVNVTNNIITNNVAGWDGAGISLLDALAANIINNTVVSNDTTASAGVLFNTLGAPLASSSGPTCTANCGTTSLPQVAGVVAIQNSAVLAANLPATITCPTGHGPGGTGTGGLTNGACRSFSYPILDNDVIWQNRAYYIGVGALGMGTTNQQNVVALYNAFGSTRAPSQPQADATTANGGGVIISGGTGACTAASYWDIGVRGDTGPTNHSGSGASRVLAPIYSVLTNITGYNAGTLHNTQANPTVASQYCNGSRVPPELGSMGYQVPPGISDATVPNPIFNLTPAATVDEGNNWINISWGPLALTHPVTGATLGNYALAAGSPAIDYIPTNSSGGTAAPFTDFFGNVRPAGTGYDVGAVEFGAVAPVVSASLTPATWTVSQTRNCPGTTGAQRLACALDPAQLFTLRNTGGVPLTGITNGVLGGANPSEYALNPLLSTCGPAGGGQLVSNTTLAPNATCVVSVQFKPLTAQTTGSKPATVSVTDSAGTQTSALNGTAR